MLGRFNCDTDLSFGGCKIITGKHCTSIWDNITITSGAAWSIEFQANGGYFETQKKSLETQSEAGCF